MRLQSRLLILLALLLAVATTVVLAADRLAVQSSTTQLQAGSVDRPHAQRAARPYLGMGRDVEAGRTREPSNLAEAAVETCPPIYSWSGEHDSDRFGEAVVPAGDMDNDGIEDFFIGAILYGVGTADPDTGRGYVYSGSDGSLLHTITAEGAGGWFGFAAASGDLDNDGYSDLILGAPYYDSTLQDVGKVYIFYGDASPRPPTFSAADADTTITGEVALGCFGWPIKVMGDLDNDNHPDVAIGADHFMGPPPGWVFVYSGQTLDTLYTLQGEGTLSDDGFGHLGTPGDVNGDGVLDLIVGEPYFGPGTGSGGIVHVFSGIDGSQLYRISSNSTTGGHLGHRSSAAGDVNGDGYDDMLLPAETAGPDNEGAVYLFLGGPGPFPIIDSVDNAYMAFYGGNYGATMGSACFLGDINLDGHDDFAAGVYQYDAGSGPGWVEIYSGVDGSLIDNIVGEESYDTFGMGLCGVSDYDNDGVGELMIGAVGYNNYGVSGPGKAYLISVGDVDADAVLAACDNCPVDANVGQEDFDLDEAGDVCDLCPRYITPGGMGIISGNVNLDTLGVINSADIIYMVNYVFKGGPEPLPIKQAGDVNFDQSETSADIIYLVNFVFKSGPDPLNCCAL